MVTELAAAEKKLANVQHDVTDLLHQQEVLEQSISQKNELLGHLKKEVEDMEKKVSDLSELAPVCNAVLADLAELEAKRKLQLMEFDVFKSFMGIVGSSLFWEAIEKFVAVTPHLISFAKARKYSPELLRNVIIKDLSGGTLEILRCGYCHARFSVDKPLEATQKGYKCPLCGSSGAIENEVTGPEIISKALAALAPHIIVVTQVTGPKVVPKKNPG